MTTLKCPQCQMSKFKKTVKIVKIADIEVLMFICATCGNVMLNASPQKNLKGEKLKKIEFGR